ncbi:hypothetical protein GCM10010260_81550 [Streptomyces filipinensis]|uniref:Uncharacterized protein n=1 Tax=Streptomyces filipinensis TaxID=66887 RepID=A0A918MF38_9ACTN|nr:hypothetical protein GCM10010260_81550 [Streptomyces filipinensis]
MPDDRQAEQRQEEQRKRALRVVEGVVIALVTAICVWLWTRDPVWAVVDFVIFGILTQTYIKDYIPGTENERQGLRGCLVSLGVLCVIAYVAGVLFR